MSEAAALLESYTGVARRSMEDYRALIRKARWFGFDFQANCDQPVGYLRNYVRECSRFCRYERSRKEKPLE